MSTLKRKGAFMRDRILTAVLPRHARRILFITVLYQLSFSDHPLTEGELEELNQALQLAETSSRALIFPSLMAGSLSWGEQAKAIANASPAQWDDMVKSLPIWLRYGRVSDIVQDLTLVRQLRSTHA